MAKQFIPFSVSGTLKLREDAAPLHKQLMPFFGFTPVPKRLSYSPAQELAAEIMANAMPSGPRTREQYDRSKLIAEMAAKIKVGGDIDVPINPAWSALLIDRLEYTPLQHQVHHFSAAAAMRVWRVANEQERASLRAIITAKLGSKSSSAPPELPGCTGTLT